MSFAEALGRIRDRKSPGAYDHLPSGLCLTVLDASNTTIRIDAGNRLPRGIELRADTGTPVPELRIETRRSGISEARLSGEASCDIVAYGGGHCNVTRAGRGHGDAARGGIGSGSAVREGFGDGGARNDALGAGDAVRTGPGAGWADRHGGPGATLLDDTGPRTAPPDRAPGDLPRPQAPPAAPPRPQTSPFMRFANAACLAASLAVHPALSSPANDRKAPPAQQQQQQQVAVFMTTTTAGPRLDDLQGPAAVRPNGTIAETVDNDAYMHRKSHVRPTEEDGLETWQSEGTLQLEERLSGLAPDERLDYLLNTVLQAPGAAAEPRTLDEVDIDPGLREPMERIAEVIGERQDWPASIKFENVRYNRSGEYDLTERAVRINPDLYPKQRTIVLAHELQHHFDELGDRLHLEGRAEMAKLAVGELVAMHADVDLSELPQDQRRDVLHAIIDSRVNPQELWPDLSDAKRVERIVERFTSNDYNFQSPTVMETLGRNNEIHDALRDHGNDYIGSLSDYDREAVLVTGVMGDHDAEKSRITSYRERQSGSRIDVMEGGAYQRHPTEWTRTGAADNSTEVGQVAEVHINPDGSRVTMGERLDREQRRAQATAPDAETTRTWHMRQGLRPDAGSDRPGDDAQPNPDTREEQTKDPVAARSSAPEQPSFRPVAAEAAIGGTNASTPPPLRGEAGADRGSSRNPERSAPER